jgi:hypothetical protein
MSDGLMGEENIIAVLFGKTEQRLFEWKTQLFRMIS